MKSRIDFSTYGSFHKLILLDATGHLSLLNNAFKDMHTVKVKLKSSAKVKFCVVAGSPYKSKRVDNTKAGLELLKANAGSFFPTSGSKMLLVHNLVKNEEDKVLLTQTESDITALAKANGTEVNIVRASRNNTRGSNEYRECDTVFLPGCSLFTTPVHYGLHCSLKKRGDVQWSDIITDNGAPRINWKSGFVDKYTQEVYIRTSLIELVQVIYRTQLRDGKAIAVVAALPSNEWLLYLAKELPNCELVDVTGSSKKNNKKFSDTGRLINTPLGMAVKKADAARMCGFTRQNAWTCYRKVLEKLLQGLFKINTKALVRTG